MGTLKYSHTRSAPLALLERVTTTGEARKVAPRRSNVMVRCTLPAAGRSFRRAFWTRRLLDSEYRPAMAPAEATAGHPP